MTNSNKPKVLILGGGFAGVTSAHLLKEKYNVTLLEAASKTGGGCLTHYYADHPYTFGPRIFFSKDEEVISTLNSLIKIREFETVSLSFIENDSSFYDYPLQWHDIDKMPDSKKIKSEIEICEKSSPDMTDFETYWKTAVGETLYEKFVDNYSKKMWGIESNKNLTANFEWVNRGTPIRDGDRRLYNDQFQGYPEASDGYNSFFEKALTDVNVITDCKVNLFHPEERLVKTSKGDFTGDIIINTLPVDLLFNKTYGLLQYAGRRLLKIMLPIEQALPSDTTWIHYSGKEMHTRVTEMKKITLHKSPNTLLIVEIPDTNSRYYPVQTSHEIERFSKYQNLFPENFYSIGRHGSFKYKGIPDAIRDALDVSIDLNG